MWENADFSICWIYFSTQQITPQGHSNSFPQKKKKRDELNYKHVNCQTTLLHNLERFEILRNSSPQRLHFLI